MTVAEKLHDLVDPKPKEPNYTNDTEEKPKPDLTAFKKAMADINKEEEEKEAFIENRKAQQAAYPKNPAVEASEAAEEAAMARAVQKAKDDKEAEEAFKASLEVKKATKKKDEHAAMISKNAELWTANM